MAWLAVFAVFCSELSAIEISRPAEILSRRRFCEQKNSEAPAVPLTGFHCFVRNGKNREGGTTVGNGFKSVARICMSAAIP
jgi:hypothetical protein